MQQCGMTLYTMIDTILHANEESLRVHFTKSIVHGLTNDQHSHQTVSHQSQRK
jgi:hypothetical protein